jgi:AcrR family transcriptional regulator
MARSKTSPSATGMSPSKRQPQATASLPGALAPADTRTRLLQAAMAEFIESGFAGTDTNKIARRAGFAPQTFYRWFDDKPAVFTEVLLVWEEVEAALLTTVITDRHTPPLQMAEACVESLRPFLTFRRNLRAVVSQDAAIHARRAQGRQRLLTGLMGHIPAPGAQPGQLSAEQLGSLIVQFEGLCEAIAHGELGDMGLQGRAALADLASLVARMRGQRPDAAAG